MVFRQNRVLKEILFPELSYNITGCVFRVQKKLGAGHREAVYQKALAEEFTLAKIQYTEQEVVKLTFNEQLKITIVPDFIVDSSVVVELKSTEYIREKDYLQAYKYLTPLNLKLSLLVHFGRKGAKIYRVINL